MNTPCTPCARPGAAAAGGAGQDRRSGAPPQKIPQKFLELILGSLKQGGFVESRRGAEGGYRLARPPNEITVGEVLKFVEEAKHAKRAPGDPFDDLWRRVDEAVADILEHTTFAELARQWQQSQSRFVANWEI